MEDEMSANAASAASNLSPAGEVKQSHLTLTFPMKSSADCAAAKEKIPSLVPELYRGADAMGTIHYCRFIELNGTIYLLADFDGELEPILEDLAKYLGPVLDPLLVHVSEPPLTPVSSNATVFGKWARVHCIEEMAEYVACPGATVKKIKSLAAAAGIEPEKYTGQQLPLLPMMPMKGRLSMLAVEGVFKVFYGPLKKGADGVGTVHFVHLVEFPGQLIGFFTVYDGPWDKYLQDFATNLGPAFDLLFQFTTDRPPFPTSKHASEFSQWVFDHELKPLAFYAAYPGLQVQDIKAMLVDAS
jgi:hypothetical protein